MTVSPNLTAPLLGVPLTICSQHPAILAAAEASLARWHALPPALIAPGPPARLEVVVRAPGEAALPRGKLVIAQQGTIWLAAGEGMLLQADLAGAQAMAFVETSGLADPERLGHDLVERLGLLLVRQRERIPFAAAAVVGAQRAVVLVASPGAELAPLLRACQDQGLALLATTTIYVGPQPAPLLWGHAKLDATSPHRHVATHARRAIFCLVTPGHGQASRIVPLDPALATAALVATSPGDDPVASQQAAAFCVAAGAHQLATGSDPGGVASLIGWLAG
ncbi:MAG: hypothetical protein AB4911_08395 [Oscillochloridaceae bacterium umkhey_bin13]